MNFRCEALTISDDPEFGCTITFSDTKAEGGEDAMEQELVNPDEKYLLIQRSYPEEEDEADWYTVETSESDIELSYKDKIIVNLSRDAIEVSWSGEQVLIGLDLDEREQSALEKMLNKRFKKRLMLTHV